MIMMKKLILTVLLVLSLPWITYSQGREVLVSIDIREIPNITVLQDVPMRICLRNPSYLIATMDQETLSQLNRFGISFRIIDESAWSGSYYLVSGPVTTGKWDPIFRTDDEVIVKIAREDDDGVPAQFHLTQNYPNPFNGQTRIRIDLPGDTRGQLAVYDIQGKLVHIVHQGSISQGSHDFQIDIKNMASGVYLLTFDTNEFRDIKKIVLLK